MQTQRTLMCFWVKSEYTVPLPVTLLCAIDLWLPSNQPFHLLCKNFPPATLLCDVRSYRRNWTKETSRKALERQQLKVSIRQFPSTADPAHGGHKVAGVHLWLASGAGEATVQASRWFISRAEAKWPINVLRCFYCISQPKNWHLFSLQV